VRIPSIAPPYTIGANENFGIHKSGKPAMPTTSKQAPSIQPLAKRLPQAGPTRAFVANGARFPQVHAGPTPCFIRSIDEPLPFAESISGRGRERAGFS
jgi:hypothetical protein